MSWTRVQDVVRRKWMQRRSKVTLQETIEKANADHVRCRSTIVPPKRDPTYEERFHDIPLELKERRIAFMTARQGAEDFLRRGYADIEQWSRRRYNELRLEEERRRKELGQTYDHMIKVAANEAGGQAVMMESNELLMRLNRETIDLELKLRATKQELERTISIDQLIRGGFDNELKRKGARNEKK